MATSYVTQATVWPSVVIIPDDIQKLIALFYETTDSKDPGAGRVLAEQVFSKSATLVSASGVFNGFDEILKCRDNAWGAVTFREHTIQQVYVRDVACRELVLLGRMRAAFMNGKSADVPFSAHVVLDENTKGHSTRVKYMEVFADSAPIAKALGQ